MRLWVDDERPAPEGWVRATTGEQAITILSSLQVEEISLDHDLGEGPSGYDVACYIEHRAVEGFCPPLWGVHSANPVGRERIAAALRAADRLYRRG